MNDTDEGILTPADAKRAAKRVLNAAATTYRAVTCRLVGHAWQAEPKLGTGDNCYVCASCQGLTVSPGGKPERFSRPMTEMNQSHA